MDIINTEFSAKDGIFTPSGVEVGIRNVHLVSGEDIIGKVSAFEDYICIDAPRVPQLMQDPSGSQIRIALIPFRPYLKKDETIKIPGDKVICVSEVTTQMEETYRNATSNLILPQARPSILS